MSNRRAFLKSSANFGMVSALVSQPIFASVAAIESSGKPPRLQLMQQLVGTSIILIEDNGNLSELEISDLLVDPVDSRIEQYHLYFSSDGALNLQERSYRMHHPKLGEQAFFLQPIEQGLQGMRYRSSISRLIEA